MFSLEILLELLAFAIDEIVEIPWDKSISSLNIIKDSLSCRDDNNELEEFFKNIDGNYNNKDLFNINLKINKNITDMSYMFDGCETLISLPDLSKWNTSNVYELYV